MKLETFLPRLRKVEREYRRMLYQTLIVDEARRAQGRDGDSELTYGTTTPRLAFRILKLMDARPEDVFYDLGCGLGVPTIVAALVCKRATGIDVLPQLTRRARGVARALELRNARFVTGDLREQDLSRGTLFYSYSTCLSKKTRDIMADAISAAKPGARVATVTHALKHPEVEFVRKVPLRWGVIPHGVFLHVRR